MELTSIINFFTPEVLTFIVIGALGGSARAFASLIRTMASGFSINIFYFFITLIISAFIGSLLGYVFGGVDLKIAALAGYAGTDILDNIFKGSLSNKILIKSK